ncbi:MAG TPA: hypothetical protein VLV86_26335 [Vicinamibacterales bacterium]|nr:hypothetical protein [Vicinamibacterales bacterium]
MSDGLSPDTRLRAQVGRFQRRLIAIACVRTLPATASVVIGGVLLVGWIAHWRPEAVAGGVAAGAVLAALSSMLLAARRTGRLAATAAAIDLRFGLANRIATALEFAAQDDQVSRLIVGDALSTLSRRSPQDLPFERPRHLGWTFAGLTAAIVAFGIVSPRSGASDDRARSQLVLNSVASTSSSNDPHARTSTASTSDESERPVASANQRGRQATSTTNSAPRADNDESAPRQAAAGNTPTESAQRNAEPGRPGEIDAVKSPSAARGVSGGQATTRQSEVSGVAVSRSNLETTSKEFRGASGSAAVRGSTTGSGGARGPSTPDARNTNTQPASTYGLERSTTQATWDRAESALARERLPLSLRSYVRSYLAAIRPGVRP